MILLDREDVDRLNLWQMPFHVHWDPSDPVQWAEGTKVDWADIPADGPFLLIVHDEEAWAGQKADHLYNVAGRRIDRPNHKWWMALADLYADSMGVSRQSLLLRYASMRRFLRRNREPWFPWEQVYHWPDKDDLVWSALIHDPRGHYEIKVREHNGERQVRYPRPPLDVRGIQEKLGMDIKAITAEYRRNYG